MIHEKWEFAARCDACGFEVTEKFGTQRALIKRLCKEGWKVFNSSKVFCPECWKRRMMEKRKELDYD